MYHHHRHLLPLYLDLPQFSTTIICIVILALAWFLFIGSDVLSYLKIGHERIDINEWRREKYYGKGDKKETKNTVCPLSISLE